MFILKFNVRPSNGLTFSLIHQFLWERCRQKFILKIPSKILNHELSGKVIKVFDTSRRINKRCNPIRKLNKVFDPSGRMKKVLDPSGTVNKVFDPSGKMNKFGGNNFEASRFDVDT